MTKEKKHFVTVNRNKDTAFYRVLKEIENKERSSFSFPGNPSKQRGLARKIGIQCKPWIDKGYLYPPTVTHNRYPTINQVMLPVEPKKQLKEKKGREKSRFYFL